MMAYKISFIWNTNQVIFCSQHTNDLAQDCSNFIANTLELLQTCAKPAKSFPWSTNQVTSETYPG